METDELKDIFLSYNKADKKWVLDLAAQIESETIDGTPASRKLSVFRPKWLSMLPNTASPAAFKWSKAATTASNLFPMPWLPCPLSLTTSCLSTTPSAR